MNPDADPKLETLFAVPMHEVRDDERAVRALLSQLERTDRRRGVILTVAGFAGAALAATLIVVSGAKSPSFEALSMLAARLWAAASQWQPPALPLPEGSVVIGLGVIALCGAAASVWRSSSSS
jgi:hypothetical protein